LSILCLVRIKWCIVRNVVELKTEDEISMGGDWRFICSELDEKIKS
jgi:hypothetical protein